MIAMVTDQWSLVRDFVPLLSLSSPSPRLLFLVFASLVSIYFFSIYDRIFICTETEKAILCNLVCKDKSWHTSVMDGWSLVRDFTLLLSLSSPSPHLLFLFF